MADYCIGLSKREWLMVCSVTGIKFDVDGLFAQARRFTETAAENADKSVKFCETDIISQASRARNLWLEKGYELPPAPKSNQ